MVLIGWDKRKDQTCGLLVRSDHLECLDVNVSQQTPHYEIKPESKHQTFFNVDLLQWNKKKRGKLKPLKARRENEKEITNALKYG